MRAGRAVGPGTSGAPAGETVSALQPAAALPCPVGPSSWRHLHETSRTRRGGCGEGHTRLVSAPATPPTHPCPIPRPRRRRIQHRERQAQVPAPPPPEANRARASPETGANRPEPTGRVGDGDPYLSSPPSASLSSAVRLGDASSLSPLAFPAAIFFSSSPKAAAAAAAVASDTPLDFMETQRIHNSDADTPPRGPGPATTPPTSARDPHTNFIATSSSAAGGSDKKSQRGGGEGGGGWGCGAPGSAAAAARLVGSHRGGGRGAATGGGGRNGWSVRG